MSTKRDARGVVRKAYAKVARRRSSCCGSSCCGKGAAGKLPVPEAELGLSCGDPVAFSLLKEGDVVVDLGSGAGKDVFLAAQKVGPKGRAIGVDMTGEMLALAKRNAAKFRERTGLSNVEFRKGFIEDLPVKDSGADVVISNCVINLSPDKRKVFREVFRVLKPGGRMVVSDIVLNRPLPKWAKDDDDLYASCISGALRRSDYMKAIRDAGFPRLKVLTDRTYRATQAGGDPITKDAARALAGAASSITVLATKGKARG